MRPSPDAFEPGSPDAAQGSAGKTPREAWSASSGARDPSGSSVEEGKERDLPPASSPTRSVPRRPVPFLRSWWETVRREPASLAYLGLVVALVALFSYGFTEAALSRYLTYNSSINDLGYWNQVFWATAHGGPAEWNATSRANFYASYPYQFLGFVVLLPFYLVQPDPTTLLWLQGTLLPLAAVPLYFLARSHNLSWTASAGLACIFLADYQLQGAVLNDFHVQAMFPFFFFAAALAEKKGRPLAFLLFGAVAALTNPLDLFVMLTFAGRWIALDFLRAGPLRVRWSRAWNTFVGDRLRAAAVLLLVGLIVAELALGPIGDYHILGSSTGPAAPYASTLSDRVTYLVMTALPFVGLSLLSVEFLVVAAPMLAFLVVGPSSYFLFFGHQDAIEYVAVFLWGFLLFLTKLRTWKVPSWVRAHAPAWSRRPSARVRDQRLRRLLRPVRRSELPLALSLVVTIALMLSYSPLSPWNDHPQLLVGVNEQSSAIRHVTNADRFLDQVLPLIPPDASVLTQNNIPQLTGRPDFNWAFAGKYAGNVTGYQYVLSDYDIESPFAQLWYYQLRPYVQQAFQTHQFGVLASGYGVALLERGYHGLPVLTAPFYFSASELEYRTGNLSGGIATHQGRADQVFWYGPYVPVLPGNYTVSFNLSVSTVVPASANIVQLVVEVDNGTQQTHIVAQNITLGQFPGPRIWTSISLNFSLPFFAQQIELPGLWVTGAAALSIADAELTQQG